MTCRIVENTLSDFRELLLILRILTMVTGRSATVPRRDEIFLKVLPQLLRSFPSLESLLRIVGRQCYILLPIDMGCPFTSNVPDVILTIIFCACRILECLFAMCYRDATMSPVSSEGNEM